MILVQLDVNGKSYFSECKTRKEADQKVAQWLEEAKKHYPNKVFTPRYYAGRRLQKV